MTFEKLAEILINKFGSWIEDGSGELLEDGGIVRDHLSDDFSREVLDSIPDYVWTAAWDIFDQKMGRGLAKGVKDEV